MLKKLIKQLATPFLCGPVIGALLQWWVGDKLRIVYYHRVAASAQDNCGVDEDLFVDQEQFDLQMALLSREFNPVSEADVLAAFQGKKSLPPKPVWVTFDDGYKDNFVLARPILRKYSIPATFFVTTGYVNGSHQPWDLLIRQVFMSSLESRVVLPMKSGEKLFSLGSLRDRLSAADQVLQCWDLCHHPDPARWTLLCDRLKVPVLKDVFMSWDEIIQLSREGFTIGSHTVSHPCFKGTVSGIINKEIVDSLNEIESKTGCKINSLAFPFGRSEQVDAAAVRGILEKTGVSLAVTTIAGVSRVPGADILALPRFGVSRSDTLAVYRCKVASGAFWQK